MTRVYPTFNAQHFTFQVCSVVSSENISYSLGSFSSLILQWLSICSVYSVFSYGLAQLLLFCACSNVGLLANSQCAKLSFLCSLCWKSILSPKHLTLNYLSPLIVHFLLIVQVTFSLSCPTRVFGLSIYFIFVLYTVNLFSRFCLF